MRKTTDPLLVIVALSGLFLIGVSTAVYAQSYIAGELGVAIPRMELVEPSFPGGTVSPASVQFNNSLMYGAKLGHYFTDPRFSWLGVEAEVFYTRVSIPQQNIVQTTTPGDVFISPPSCTGATTCLFNQPGLSLSVINWAPINLLVRYPGLRFQPYAGVGLGLFFASLNGTRDTAPGLNALVGARYLVSENVGVFVEGKYNRADLSFSGEGFGYKAYFVAFGLSYHFK